MTIGLILLTLISSVSVNEALSDSLIRQGYDADGNLLGYVCNQYGQCQWVLLEPSPFYYSPPSDDDYSPPDEYYSPPPQQNYSHPPQNQRRNDSYLATICNACELCKRGSIAACAAVSGEQCAVCKNVSKSDNRNIDRISTGQRCTLQRATCRTICGGYQNHSELCYSKCESEYEECLSKVK